MTQSKPDVTLVVVCYEMGRELPRTLTSLAPPYQHGYTPDVCEIIVVDNGSRKPPDPRDYRHLDANIQFCSSPVV